MPKSFTEQEKSSIRQKLIADCKEKWERFGYKKTSIDELCLKAGISKGAFYIFFTSKEQLFLEALKEIQKNLYHCIEEILSAEQNKFGIAKALRVIFREYDKSPFLYDTTSPDFTSFMNKLTEEERESVYYDSLAGAKVMLYKPFLKLRISEEKALSVMAALLSLIASKDKMACNHFEVFDFMLDNLIDKLFE
ncbi:TetR family transcriptional regulator [Anaerocolumna cellulosilytica]|uniref:TetR family transcriptional regulator n=1 Tax=Anaerocolumna cellulosilytica TaxID=433286 RepID=A0A6S6R405_9FIRM|nr:TetR/AcrR family transcriptional regulator [Anaerocolumna cellulosilytica]MBB5194824.1 AcrR family transcriptional regulator [Anaerocolumna cellulosilytica]BCJ94212.1 TetR family transcriptional regulator [Anaerocolumna cellulosilytica]